MTISHYPLTLFFDGACPVCRHEMTALRRRDRLHRLRFEDVRSERFAQPAGTTLRDMLEAIHARTAGGRIVAAVEALHLAYGAVGLGWLVAPARWPLLRGASERAYRWVARHRFALPAWVGFAGFALRDRAAPCDDDHCAL